jgi:uncharacterized protein
MTETLLSDAGSAYRKYLREYIAREANPRHKYGHQPRLYALTQQIGKGLQYDDDIVFAAVWLHDLGVFVGHRPEEPAALKVWDHVAYITQRAPAILIEAGFPAMKIPAVLEVIRTHQPQDTPLTVEATIARDADILEQLGAMGIIRTIAKLGSDTRFNTFMDVQAALQKQLTNLPAQLRLASSIELAKPRVEILERLLQAISSEAGENLY